MAGTELLRLAVAYSPEAGRVDVVSLMLAPGATVSDALQASGLLLRHGLALAGMQVGVWCRRCDLATPLRDRDRVEIYRALQVDPKEARRQRYRQHLARYGPKPGRT
jgi:putative ubiquitin-RnfH superfamily antitoxin RatB of RatAB toxin-antitoxin module